MSGTDICEDTTEYFSSNLRLKRPLSKSIVWGSAWCCDASSHLTNTQVSEIVLLLLVLVVAVLQREGHECAGGGDGRQRAHLLGARRRPGLRSRCRTGML